MLKLTREEVLIYETEQSMGKSLGQKEYEIAKHGSNVLPLTWHDLTVQQQKAWERTGRRNESNG